ncbi:DUF6214 family protein [Corynebacterium variabile]|uniref:DUF6214 family protein n=1 Tax=Corynebacterium variabile TaxID=1727 RepID=UPI0028AEC1C1|nr:DUF6214 family protein [Corynebacterium variabile]
MEVGEWEYIGVTLGEFPGVDVETYVVEARLPRRGTAWYVRLRISATTDGELTSANLVMHSVHIDVLDPTGDVYKSAAEMGGYGILPLFARELSRVPYSRLLAQATVDLSRTDDFTPDDPDDLPDFHALRAEWPNGQRADEVALWAGNLYTRAVVDGQAATKAVEDAFGVSKSTAKRMIARARDSGYLADDVVGAPVPSRKRKEPHHEQGKD